MSCTPTGMSLLVGHPLVPTLSRSHLFSNLSGILVFLPSHMSGLSPQGLML